jgi:hypothetical protein
MMLLTYLKFDKYGDECIYNVIIDNHGAFDISLNFFDENQVDDMAQALDAENIEEYTFIPGDWAAAHVDSETSVLIGQLKQLSLDLINQQRSEHMGAFND